MQASNWGTTRRRLHRESNERCCFGSLYTLVFSWACTVALFTTITEAEPRIDLGNVGYGGNFITAFTEGADPRIRSYLSQPLAIRLETPGSTTFEQVNLSLKVTLERYDGASFNTTDEEFILPTAPAPAGIMMSSSVDGRGLQLTASGSPPSLVQWRSFLGSIVYQNNALEPSIFTRRTEGGQRLFRQVEWSIQDIPATTGPTIAARTFVDVTTINDNKPVLCARSCGSPTCTNSARRRRSTDDPHALKYEALSRRMNGIRKKKAPRVSQVNIFPSTEGKFVSGASIFVDFDQPTNSPQLKSSSIRILPSHLTKNKFYPVWAGNSRLILFFPEVSQEKTEEIRRADVRVHFLPPKDYCNKTNVCSSGICHKDGWSCAVVGSFGHGDAHHQQLDPDETDVYYSQHHDNASINVIIFGTIAIIILLLGHMFAQAMLPAWKKPEVAKRKSVVQDCPSTQPVKTKAEERISGGQQSSCHASVTVVEELSAHQAIRKGEMHLLLDEAPVKPTQADNQ